MISNNPAFLGQIPLRAIPIPTGFAPRLLGVPLQGVFEAPAGGFPVPWGPAYEEEERKKRKRKPPTVFGY